MMTPEYISTTGLRNTDFCPTCNSARGTCQHPGGIKQTYFTGIAKFHIQLNAEANNKNLEYSNYVAMLQQTGNHDFSNLQSIAQEKVARITELINKLTHKIKEETKGATTEKDAITKESDAKLNAIKKATEECKAVTNNLEALFSKQSYKEFVGAPGSNDEIPKLIMSNVDSLKTLSERSLAYEASLNEKLKPHVKCETQIQGLNSKVSGMTSWPTWEGDLNEHLTEIKT